MRQVRTFPLTPRDSGRAARLRVSRMRSAGAPMLCDAGSTTVRMHAMPGTEPTAHITFAALPPRVREAAAAALVDHRAEQRLLADGFIESYVCWREACGDVHATYERWRTCKPRKRGLAFGSHCAALDREGHAARIHASWADWLGAEDAPRAG